MRLITDPSRLLPGGFWTIELPAHTPCYVLGCYDEAVVGRRHRVHGLVDACYTHDPDRHGYAKGLVPVTHIRITPPNGKDDGTRVRSSRPSPAFPPAGALSGV